MNRNLEHQQSPTILKIIQCGDTRFMSHNREPSRVQLDQWTSTFIALKYFLSTFSNEEHNPTVHTRIAQTKLSI